MLEYLTEREFISWARRVPQGRETERDLALLSEAIDRLEAMLASNEALKAEVATYGEEGLCT